MASCPRALKVIARGPELRKYCVSTSMWASESTYETFQICFDAFSGSSRRNLAGAGPQRLSENRAKVHRFRNIHPGTAGGVEGRPNDVEGNRYSIPDADRTVRGQAECNAGRES